MKKYKHTLNLPKTSFPIKSSTKREEEIVKEFETDKLYYSLQNSNKQPFTLHDGPPYANGHLHHGHILNKVLKDIVYKSHTMMGYNVDFKPGWDCHGLPIEVEVDKKLGSKRREMSKLELRQAYREYAKKFVDIQRDEFKRLGIIADWEYPYLTMDYTYEAETLRQFNKIVKAGLVYRDLKPVFWCPTHRTALAESEIEYIEGHQSESVYALFPMAYGHNEYIAVWTTTPWTLSVNKAVAVKGDAFYIMCEIGGKQIWFAEDLADQIAEKLGHDPQKQLVIFRKHRGHVFAGKPNEPYVNPLNNQDCPIFVSDHVTTDSGTGFVHIAPAHGEDDFKLGKQHNLEIENAIGDNGKSADGLNIKELNDHVINELKSKDRLLSKETTIHKYPYSTRSHRPVITRATSQWFINIDKPFNNGPNLRDRAIQAVDEVTWVPKTGKKRILGMLKTRPDWCISRQRVWGVPIHAYNCSTCNYFEFEKDIDDLATLKFELYGSDFWFWPNKGPNIKCPNCKTKLIMNQDILDVWFDSGVSNAAVLGGTTADLYLEGSDQHRGWFQSTLLAALGSENDIPYKTVLTHGFVVDNKGEKLSKSKRNYTDPFKIIKQYGAEVFRLWVAQSDFKNDVRVSAEALDGAKRTAHKIRNTVRYLLSNLYDFDPKAFNRKQRKPEIDSYIIGEALLVYNRAMDYYKSFQFHTIVKEVESFCINDLSSFYIEVSRDRLYCDKADSTSRRSAQAAMYLIARMLITIMAPIMSFTMHDAWKHLPNTKNNVFKASLKTIQHSYSGSSKFKIIRHIREIALVELEKLRQAGKIGAAYEAQATVTVAESFFQISPHTIEKMLGVSGLLLRCDNVTEPTVEVSK